MAPNCSRASAGVTRYTRCTSCRSNAGRDSSNEASSACFVAHVPFHSSTTPSGVRDDGRPYGIARTASTRSQSDGSPDNPARARKRFFSSSSAIPTTPYPLDDPRIQLQRPLAVVGGVAEDHAVRRRALEVQVRVVLPREPDPAVELDALAGDGVRGVRAVRLRDGRRRTARPAGRSRARRPRSTPPTATTRCGRACPRTCAGRPGTRRSDVRTPRGPSRTARSCRAPTASRRPSRRTAAPRVAVLPARRSIAARRRAEVAALAGHSTPTRTAASRRSLAAA